MCAQKSKSNIIFICYATVLNSGWLPGSHPSLRSGWTISLSCGTTSNKNVQLVFQYCRKTSWIASCTFYPPNSNLSRNKLGCCRSTRYFSKPATTWFVSRQVWFVSGKTRKIAFYLVLRQCCKTSCKFFSPFTSVTWLYRILSAKQLPLQLCGRIKCHFFFSLVY